ncbi:uncharacterized protein LOC133177183 [Saccostrea echinata]|uniref:uncharacterized protein LOC133177183 n=1 Tax=Saccostrea echinata TaxID=191078 RepID=UPI002A827BB5|nr:uncharacterized protein LOC133177183 [Saccostrea echinata]
MLFEDSTTLYRDIDVDEKYIYAVGMYNRMIHVIWKSTGKLQSQKPLSPYLGTVSFILKVPDVQRGYRNNATLNDPISESDTIAIVLICFTVIAVLTFFVAGFTFFRRRGKCFCFRRILWEKRLPQSNMRSIYSFPPESSIRHPPPLPKRS